MKSIRACLVTCVMAMSTLTAAAAAQSSGFAVSVRPAMVGRSGDTITMAYVLTVSPVATDSLSMFMVAAPGVVSVKMPGDWPVWSVASVRKSVAVAQWAKHGPFVGAADSTPPLQFAARGLLDVVQYWAETHVPADTFEVVSIDTVSATADSSVTIRGGATGFTVGVGVLPPDLSSSALGTRLAALIDRICSLGWIDNDGVCNSLHVKAMPDAGQLGAMLNELDAQRGQHISESAYVLLSENARYLLTRL